MTPTRDREEAGGRVAAKVQKVLRDSKDAALAFGTRVFLNTRLRGIGDMTELVIDTKKQSVRVRVNLLGEAEAIEIDVKKYLLTERGEKSVLTISDVTTSREWLTEALRQFVVGRPITIPPAAGAILKLLT